MIIQDGRDYMSKLSTCKGIERLCKVPYNRKFNPCVNSIDVFQTVKLHFLFTAYNYQYVLKLYSNDL